MASYSFKGFVDELFEKGAYGREFIIRNCKNPLDEKYPQFVTFNLNAKNVGLMDGIGIGSEVKVEFDIRGSKGVSKKTNKPYHITKLNAFKVEVVTLVKEQEPIPEDGDDEDPDAGDDGEPSGEGLPF